jgi:hypothetical protein
LDDVFPTAGKVRGRLSKGKREEEERKVKYRNPAEDLRRGCEK